MSEISESSILADTGKILLGAVLGAVALGAVSYFIAEHSDSCTIPDDAFDDESLNGEDDPQLQKNDD